MKFLTKFDSVEDAVSCPGLVTPQVALVENVGIVYGNNDDPNETMTIEYVNGKLVVNKNIPLQSLSILGSTNATGNDDNNKEQYTIQYTPANTTETGVNWSIVSGSNYVSINQNGVLTIYNDDGSHSIVIRATSTANSDIYVDKQVTVFYSHNSTMPVNPGGGGDFFG